MSTNTDQTAGVITKIREELAELESAHSHGNSTQIDEELGDLLFSVVNLARFRNTDPELLMANANAKFEHRFAAMEQHLKHQGLTLESATPEQMENSWEKVKEG